MPDLYVPLDVNFQDDDRLIDVSSDAELMFIRSLALCKRLLNDGMVTRGQARRLGDKLEDWQEAAQELVDAGLWEDLSREGYLVRSWVKHNRTAEDIENTREAKRQGGSLGNHNRHHRDKGVVNPDCRHCVPEQRSHSESHSDDGSESHDRSDSDRQSRDRVETETPSADGAKEALAAAISTACRQERIPPPDTRPRQQLDVAAADIAAQGGQPHEVPGKAREFRRLWPEATLTPMALAKHWLQLVPETVDSRPEAKGYDPTPALRAAGLEEDRKTA